MNLAVPLKFQLFTVCLKDLESSFTSCTFHSATTKPDEVNIFLISGLKYTKNRILQYSSSNDE